MIKTMLTMVASVALPIATLGGQASPMPAANIEQVPSNVVKSEPASVAALPSERIAEQESTVESEVKTPAIPTGFVSNPLRSKVRSDSITVEEGVLKIIESVNVPSERSGILRSIRVKEGDLIEAGSVVAQIDDQQTQLLMEQAQVELEIAKHEAKDDISVRFSKKALAVAEAELRRALELRSGDFDLVTDTEIDRLTLIKEKSELDIERAEMDLTTLQMKTELKHAELAVRSDDVDRHRVQCPIDGMVVNVEKRVGEWINESDTIARIVRINRLRVEGLVTAGEAAQGLVGRPVTLTVNVPGLESAEFEGNVVFVNPEANPFNMKVRIWAEVENEGLKLFPGWKANVQIH